MPSYLYGLVHAADGVGLPADVRGLDDAPVRVVPCGPLGAIVSDVVRAPAARVDDVKRHDRVLRDAVAAGCTVVASRFGQTFENDEVLCREVGAHGARARRALDAHGGCVEMRILVPGIGAPAPAPPPADTERPGRAYLEGLRQQAAARSPAFSVRAEVGPTVRAERVEPLPGAAGAAGVAVAHLVARPDLPAWREAVARLPALASARVIGPLPLYSFAEPPPGGPDE